MDRLEKVIKIMIDEHNANCSEHDCVYCKYYNGDCNLDYLINALFKWDKTIPKEPSITLKNIDLSEVTLEQQINKVIEERTELFDALNKFKEDEETKEHVIEELYDNIQALLRLVQKFGINAEEVMAEYPKHLQKMESRGNKPRKERK